MFQPLIVIYRRGNFVYQHLESSSFYWPLSYPFRSLRKWTYGGTVRQLRQLNDNYLLYFSSRYYILDNYLIFGVSYFFYDCVAMFIVFRLVSMAEDQSDVIKIRDYPSLFWGFLSNFSSYLPHFYDVI